MGNMKLFAVLTLAAVAFADPEADAFYGYYGYARPYAYGAGYGYTTYGAYPYAYYGKRSADAEAAPPLLSAIYGTGFPYGYGYFGPAPQGGYVYFGKRPADAEPMRV